MAQRWNANLENRVPVSVTLVIFNYVQLLSEMYESISSLPSYGLNSTTSIWKTIVILNC